MRSNSPLILSVDVEDYFQVEAFANDVPRSEWDRYTPRVEGNTLRLLELFERHQAKATFFTLGWVAQKFPALVRRIHESGHEVACHSFWHRRVYTLNREEFRKDLIEAREALEQACGARVAGYRAPSWSITKESLWALDILADEGFVYDSSIFPITHDVYGIPDAQRTPYTIRSASGGELKEFPPATVRLFGRNLPAAGGGYLRMLPFWYNRWALRRLASEPDVVPVVYLHPWEIDPEQPRISTSSLKSSLRHYSKLQDMESRLTRLLEAHAFRSFSDLLAATA